MSTGLKRNDDFNGAEQEGAGLYQVTCRRGRRWSTYDAFLKPARDRFNLTVATGALAARVLLDGDRATGVVFRQGGADQTVLARREVVLCGGAINSPQLLLLSAEAGGVGDSA